MNDIESLTSHPMCTWTHMCIHVDEWVHMGCDLNSSIVFMSMNESCLMRGMSHVPWDVAYEWVMSHMRIWMSHVSRAHMNESCLTCANGWVMSHVGQSCHIWMSHITYGWVMPHINASCHILMSPVIFDWVMSHMIELCLTWMSHATYEWVVSHINESCLSWMSRVTFEWVISCMNWDMSHTNESCHI